MRKFKFCRGQIIQDDNAGTYYPAEEVYERIAYLEKAYKELHRDTTAMMGEDNKRIKVLEDALKEIEKELDDACPGYVEGVANALNIACAALEVKP
jgi:hypothetical protein